MRLKCSHENKTALVLVLVVNIARISTVESFFLHVQPFSTTAATYQPTAIPISSIAVKMRRNLSFSRINTSDVDFRNQTESPQSLMEQSRDSVTSTNSEETLSPHRPQQQQPLVARVESSLDTIAVVTASSTLLLAALLGLVAASGPGGWRYYVAGGACAAISHAIATPIDVVKTRKQVDPDLIHTSFASATARIIKTEGLKALLSGLGPTTFGYLLEGSLKFGIYEILKPAAKNGFYALSQYTSFAWLQSQFLSFVVCGAISGVIASFVLCPMEAIRIRMVAEPNFCTTNWIEGGYKMVKGEGISALSKGLIPMLYKQVPYTIAKNVSFDILTRRSYDLLRAAGIATTGTTTMLIPLASALVTSVLATIFSQPGDTLLSLVNAHEGTLRTNDFIRDILHQDDGGFKGFFVGTKSRFLHVGIIVTSQLILYDVIKRLVGIAPTGSV